MLWGLRKARFKGDKTLLVVHSWLLIGSPTGDPGTRRHCEGQKRGLLVRGRRQAPLQWKGEGLFLARLSWSPIEGRGDKSPKRSEGLRYTHHPDTSGSTPLYLGEQWRQSYFGRRLQKKKVQRGIPDVIPGHWTQETGG